MYTCAANNLAIVGAGSAGGVVAARVTDNPRLRVLLIEGGPECDRDR